MTTTLLTTDMLLKCCIYSINCRWTIQITFNKRKRERKKDRKEKKERKKNIIKNLLVYLGEQTYPFSAKAMRSD